MATIVGRTMKAVESNAKQFQGHIFLGVSSEDVYFELRFPFQCKCIAKNVVSVIDQSITVNGNSYKE